MSENKKPIPEFLAHLPVDKRGYPIPYFVAWPNGVPDFRYQDPKKKQACRLYHKCFVCGQSLFKSSYWFIAGPIGLQNRVTSDEAMHENCARYSLEVCPHLYFEKAERRPGPMAPLITQATGKPIRLFLVKADKIIYLDQMHTRFRPVQRFEFHYRDNKLCAV